MVWFKVFIISLVLLFVGVYGFLFFSFSEDESIIEPPKKIHYGSEQPIRIDNQLVAIYEPITQTLRQPNLKDKMYYGELKN